MIANGKQIQCGYNQNIKLLMGNYYLDLDMFVIPMRLEDVVLRVQWFK